MLYPPPEGTGIVCTKTNHIKFYAATVISLAEIYLKRCWMLLFWSKLV